MQLKVFPNCFVFAFLSTGLFSVRNSHSSIGIGIWNSHPLYWSGVWTCEVDLLSLSSSLLHPFLFCTVKWGPLSPFLPFIYFHYSPWQPAFFKFEVTLLQTHWELSRVFIKHFSRVDIVLNFWGEACVRTQMFADVAPDILLPASKYNGRRMSECPCENTAGKYWIIYHILKANSGDCPDTIMRTLSGLG